MGNTTSNEISEESYHGTWHTVYYDVSTNIKGTIQIPKKTIDKMVKETDIIINYDSKSIYKPAQSIKTQAAVTHKGDIHIFRAYISSGWPLNFLMGDQVVLYIINSKDKNEYIWKGTYMAFCPDDIGEFILNVN